MIGAIKGLEQSEVNAVLAKAAQLLLKNPPATDADIDHRRFAETGLAGQIVLELRNRIERPNQTSAQLHLRLTEELSREISDYGLTGSDIQEIRARAGQRGSLSSGLYEIIFSDHFHELEPLQCIQESPTPSEL